jgi:hypothetical protein
MKGITGTAIMYFSIQELSKDLIMKTTDFSLDVKFVFFSSAGTTIVHFSVQKLLSKDHILKTTDFNIPDFPPEFPLAVNETGLVSFNFFESL